MTTRRPKTICHPSRKFWFALICNFTQLQIRICSWLYISGQNIQTSLMLLKLIGKSICIKIQINSKHYLVPSLDIRAYIHTYTHAHIPVCDWIQCESIGPLNADSGHCFASLSGHTASFYLWFISPVTPVQLTVTT